MSVPPKYLFGNLSRKILIKDPNWLPVIRIQSATLIASESKLSQHNTKEAPRTKLAQFPPRQLIRKEFNRFA